MEKLHNSCQAHESPPSILTTPRTAEATESQGINYCLNQTSIIKRIKKTVLQHEVSVTTRDHSILVLCIVYVPDRFAKSPLCLSLKENKLYDALL